MFHHPRFVEEEFETESRWAAGTRLPRMLGEWWAGLGEGKGAPWEVKG